VLAKAPRRKREGLYGCLVEAATGTGRISNLETVTSTRDLGVAGD